jgi:hypothetical protein
MIDPASVKLATDVASAASAASRVMPSFMGGKLNAQPRFGLGQPAIEASCPAIQFFLTCMHDTAEERLRLHVPVQTTVAQARAAFEHHRQLPLHHDMECVDENGFVIGGIISKTGGIVDSNDSMPVSHLSNGCHASVSWQHKRHSMITRVVSDNVPTVTAPAGLSKWNPFKKSVGENSDATGTKSD